VDGGGHWPIVLIEIVLVFGGVLVFGWWQLRSVERDRREAARRRAAEAEAAAGAVDGPAAPAPPAVPPGDAHF
jgi:hypothetical protein